MIFPYGIKKIEDLYNNSELGSSGFYPIGTGNLWHSGVHLNLIGNNSDVYSLLPNGKVIAYRLDDKYEDCDLPDKITVDQFNHEFNTSNYHKKYKEVKDGESTMYYTLDESLKDKTYSISPLYYVKRHKGDLSCIYEILNDVKAFIEADESNAEIIEKAVEATKYKGLTENKLRKIIERGE